MKIYLVVKNSKRINQFVPELICALESAGHTVDIGLSILWSEKVEQYDVVYFQWPEYTLGSSISEKDVSRLEKRIIFLKEKGVLIVSQCHNLHPHNTKKILESKLYDVIYGNCDIIVHMGTFSQKTLQSVYPQIKHVIVPHHIYDHTYSFTYDQENSKKKLGYAINKNVILCFGTFRNDEERRLILNLKKYLNKDEYELAVPGFYQGKVFQKNLAKGFQNLLRIIKYRYDGLNFSTHFISDEMMQIYFCAADLVLIQRPNILNSGNLPMGFAAGKVVVGPDVGNVGEILKCTGNPVYNPTDVMNLYESVISGIHLSKLGLGEKNREYAYRNWNTRTIGLRLSEVLYDYMKQQKEQ